MEAKINKLVKSVEVVPGLKRKVLATGGKLMLTENRFKKGVNIEPHNHYHEQVSYIVSGEFEFCVGDAKRIIGPGDSLYIPPNEVHGVRALEGGVIIDVFTPQREDFK